MVESTHSCNNNSVDRIISKEEEREDPRRDSSIYLRVQVQWCFHNSTRTTVSTRNPASFQSSCVIPCRSLQGIFQQLLPCLQALHTAGSSYKAPYSIPGPYNTSRLPVILPSRNSILHGSQHPRSPYSNSQASSTVLHYRILPGEIGFFPKGLSIVYPIQY